MMGVASHSYTNSNLKSLQILRAIAATTVVYFHIGAIPKFGSFGVDIFFVISGFVMAMVIANGQDSYTFAVSRLTRIIPLYWILTTFVLLLAAVKPELFNSTTANLSNYLKSIFFIPYFKENGALNPMLPVGWTLNYEMFFYLCIWLSIIVSRKYYFLLTTLFLTSMYLWFGEHTHNLAASQFFHSELLFEFIFGMLAFEVNRINFPRESYKYIFVFLAVGSYAAMATIEATGFEANRVLIYGIPSVVLILSLTQLEYLFQNDNPITNILTIIGDGSYATYLSHFYVVEGIRKVFFHKLNLIDPYTPTGVSIILLLSLVVGHLIFKFVDNPLHKYFKGKFLALSKSPR
jgi:exopolysaccharide production protein ExoZ